MIKLRIVFLAQTPQTSFQKMNWVYFTFLSLLIQEFELMITCFNEDQELSKASTFQECSCESERVRSYSLESLIAVSGQAKIYLGKKDGVDYALKIFESNSKNDMIYHNEASFLSKMQARGIVPIEQCMSGVSLTTNEIPLPTMCNIIVMPFIKKGDLHTWVTRKQPFQENIARYFALELIGRFRYLSSKNIFHKDIKAENVMLGEDFKPLLIDFGLATYSSYSSPSFAGTARYAPPEVVKQKHYTSKSQIYSLGILFFFMLTGKYPYSIAKITEPGFRLIFEKNFKQFWLDFQKKNLVKLSSAFKELFVRMVDHNPDNRPSLDDLLEFQWFKQDALTQDQFQEWMKAKQIGYVS